MKIIITEHQYYRAIDSFISFLLEPHEVRTSSEYPNFLFWFKDGMVIAEIQNSEYFWLHDRIWNVISEQFGFKYAETQSVIKTWLEQHYELGGLTPRISPVVSPSRLEQHYELGGLTPVRGI